LTAAATILSGTAPTRARVVVTAWNLNTQVSDGIGLTSVRETTVAPVFTLARRVQQNGSIAKTIYDIDSTSDLDSFTFSINFDHIRSGNKRSDARSTGLLAFSVMPGSEAQFDISGIYELSSGSDLIGVDVKLHDLATGVNLLSGGGPHLSASSTAPVTVDQVATLVDGHDYLLKYGFFVSQTAKKRDSGASGVGDLRLNVRSAIPLPASVWMGMALVGCLGVVRAVRGFHRPS
jgi:hypothetical protein